MHRELTSLEKPFQTASVAGLYVFTLLIAVLVGLDVGPDGLGWLNATFGWELPTWTPGFLWNGVVQRFALLAAVLGGARVLYSAFEGLLAGRVGADVALAIAVVAAILIHQPLVAAEVILIGLVGECLEAYTFGHAQRALGKLVETIPPMCLRLRDGVEEKVPLDSVVPGDRVRVLPGKRVPVDGVIVAGSTTMDQSTLTGESLPVDKQVGDEVFAGTINQFGSVVVEARKVTTQTVMGRVIEMTLRAIREKTTSERLADRLARYFLPVVLLLAVVTYLGHGLWARGQADPWYQAVYPALAVLVVACPCALILATPATRMAALARLARSGVVIKNGGALERLAAVTAVAFDKTGTLTHSRLQVGDVVPLAADLTADQLLSLAGALERFSEHPIGRAVFQAAQERQLEVAEVAEFQALPGAGVVGRIADVDVVVGNRRCLRDRGIDIPSTADEQLATLEATGQTGLLVARGGTILGVMGVWDTIREDAAAVVAELRTLGLADLALLTGDRPAPARAIADRVGIDTVAAELLPADKARFIAEWQKLGKSVAMLGDGVNDAPALATANVGLALGGVGSDLASEAGDIVLMGAPIRPLPFLVRLSRFTMTILWQNIIVFAFAVNLLGILITAWILPFWSPQAREASPLWAAIYHQIGSVAVLLNAMRILWFEKERERGWFRQVQQFSTRLDELLGRLDPHELAHRLEGRGRAILLGVTVIALLTYAASGLTQIEAGTIGLVKRFGRLLPPDHDLTPGLHWRWPWPWEVVLRTEPDRLRQVEVGFRGVATTSRDATNQTWGSEHSDIVLPDREEGLMLTGDGSLLELQAVVHFRVSDPRTHLLAARDAETWLRTTTEEVLREQLAGRRFLEVLADRREEFQRDTLMGLRRRLAMLPGGLGVEVQSISLRDIHPPVDVLDAYYEVTRALSQQARTITQAMTARESELAREQVARTRVLATTQARWLDTVTRAAADRDAFLSLALTYRAELPLILPWPTGHGPVGVAAIPLGPRATSHAAEMLRSLIELRLTLDAAEGVLTGRNKILVDPRVRDRVRVWPETLRGRSPDNGRDLRRRNPLGLPDGSPN